MYYQNIDCDSTILPFVDALAKKEHIEEKDLYPFIDEFVDTNVTDILLNVNGQASMSPSRVMDDPEDIYARKQEDGYAVDYTDVMGGMHTVLTKFGDPFAVWFKRIRACGMRAHLSIRMNDCHCPNEPTCWLRSSFFYKARDLGYMDCVKSGHFIRSLNYKYPEVRKLFLDYIREQLFRYETDGIELDYMRDMFCTDYAGADKDTCVSIMNDFMRQVKAIVNEAEAHYGHKIECIVRMSRDIHKSLALGYDVRAWEKEGLIDTVIPSPRFHGSDSHMPIAEWKAELPKTKILPCLEGLASTDWGMSRNGFARMTAEMLRGHTIHYLAEGADGIYTFNLFGQKMAGEDVHLRDKETQKTIGTYEQTIKGTLRFVTIGEDADFVPVGFERWMPLPADLKVTPTVFTIRTGALPAEKKLTLVLGFNQGSPTDARITLNGKEIKAFAKIPTPKPENALAKGSVCYACEIAERAPIYEITICQAADTPLTVTWVEISAK